MRLGEYPLHQRLRFVFLQVIFHEVVFIVRIRERERLLRLLHAKRFVRVVVHAGRAALPLDVVVVSLPERFQFLDVVVFGYQNLAYGLVLIIAILHDVFIIFALDLVVCHLLCDLLRVGKGCSADEHLQLLLLRFDRLVILALILVLTLLLRLLLLFAFVRRLFLNRFTFAEWCLDRRLGLTLLLRDDNLRLRAAIEDLLCNCIWIIKGQCILPFIKVCGYVLFV